jgi:hypothetical protein
MTAKTLVQTLVEIYGRIGDFHITPCDGAIPVSEADRLAEKAVEDYIDAIIEALEARWAEADALIEKARSAMVFDKSWNVDAYILVPQFDAYLGQSK